MQHFMLLSLDNPPLARMMNGLLTDSYDSATYQPNDPYRGPLRTLVRTLFWLVYARFNKQLSDSISKKKLEEQSHQELTSHEHFVLKVFQLHITS